MTGKGACHSKWLSDFSVSKGTIWNRDYFPVSPVNGCACFWQCEMGAWGEGMNK